MESTTPSQQPIHQPGQRREGLWLGLAAVLGALVVLAGLWLASGRSIGIGSTDDSITAEAEPTTSTLGQDDEASASADDADTTPTTTDDAERSSGTDGETPTTSGVDVETVPCPAGTQQEICEAVEFVQQARQRPFKQFPTVELLSDGAFDDELLALVEEEEEAIRAEGRVLKSLGLVDADMDLFQLYLDLLEIGVVGFYEPESDRMVVRGEEFNLYGQLVLVHELAHAFDDQWHDLNRDDFPHLDAEYAYAAVVEGNASRVEDAWRNSLSAGDQALLSQQELSALSPDDFARMMALPPVLLEMQISPYVDGKAFMLVQASNGGEAAANELLDTPPETSEQILHPTADPEVLNRNELPAAPVEGTDRGEGQLGEFLISLWLGERAAAGWGDDTYRVSEQGGTICTTVRISADSDTDLDELEDALDGWVGQADGRTVERGNIEADVGTVEALTAEGCYR